MIGKRLQIAFIASAATWGLSWVRAWPADRETNHEQRQADCT
jgi:hypothetical protein